MKRREITLKVTDHAVLRYLQRRHDVDVEAVRRHLAGLSVGAAQLGAVAVRVEDVRIFLQEEPTARGRPRVIVSTVKGLRQRRGLGVTERDDG